MRTAVAELRRLEAVNARLAQMAKKRAAREDSPSISGKLRSPTVQLGFRSGRDGLGRRAMAIVGLGMMGVALRNRPSAKTVTA